MAISFKTIWAGVKIKAKAVLTSDTLGELETSNVTNKTYLHNGTTRSPLVTEEQVAILSNKTIDADDNTISDLEVDNLKSGVLNTSTTLASASNLQVPSALAVKTYVDNGLALQNQASEITYDNTTSGLTATNVQTAIDEVDFDLDATQVILADHIADTSDAHDASAISNIPSGNLAATEVQAALNELQTDVDTRATATALNDHINDAVDAHDASAISVVPASGIVATNVQAALEELSLEIAAGGNGDVFGPASSTDNAIARFDLTTGKLIQNSVVTVSDAGVIAGASINADTNTITNIENADIKVGAAIDASKIADGSVSNAEFQYIGALTSDAQAQINSKQSTLVNSAGLAAALSDETGTGLVVFNNAPTITGASIQSPSRLDVKKDTKANLVTYALTASNGQFVFATDTKEMLQVVDTLLVAVGSGGGTASVDILSTEIADNAVLADFTQTGLEIVDSPIVLHGTKSFRLQHATSIKSFKKIIPVDRKFRGKNNTINLDVISTATNANLNIIFRDETNSLNLGVSQAIATGSAAIVATTANASNQLTGMTNTVLNTLKVGMVITGSAIPVATTITAISSTAATMSQNATGVSTGIRISDLVSKKSFSVDIPANCLSFSWAISTVVEAATESYIDDVVVQLTAATLSSTSVTVPKNNDYGATIQNTMTIGATTTAPTKGTIVTDRIIHSRVANRLVADYQYQQSSAGAVGSGDYLFTLPSSLQFDSSVVNFHTGVIISSIFPKSVVGTAALSTGSVATYTGHLVAYDSTRFRIAVGYNTQDVRFISNTWFELTNVAIGFSGHLDAPIAGWSANETETKTIPLTSAQLVQTPDSAISRQGHSGWGSTAFNTFSVKITASDLLPQVGNSIAFSTSASTGDLYTVLENGIYQIDATIEATIADAYLALFVNNDRIQTASCGVETGEYYGVLSASQYLTAGTVIRIAANTTSNGGSLDRVNITKQGSLKQLNLSSDSKIQIPTHQLRFEGASARGSTDTAIVKFDTQAITQGDAWDVVNTAANGTVITMKKAGILTVNYSLSLTSAGNLTGVSLNQSNLTAIALTSETIAMDTVAGANYGAGSSATVAIKVGDKLRVWSETTISSGESRKNQLSFSLTETSIPANFSNVLPQWSQSDSSVQLRTANGYGSTNTRVRRFSNTVNNLGTAITYTDSSTDGASFLINEDGEYQISYTDLLNISDYFGITKNSAELTTNVTNLTVPVSLLSVGATIAANTASSTSWQGYLLKGDVIRAHTNAAATGSAGTLEAKFSINKVGKPNLTAVDVTPFVNMKTIDTQNLEYIGVISTPTGSVLAPTSLTKNTNNGIISYDASSGRFNALVDCQVDATCNTTVTGTTIAYARVRKNGVPFFDGSYGDSAAGSNSLASGSFFLAKGEYITFFNGSANTLGSTQILITATADNNAIATPTQQVSSDTMSFAFKATTITDTDAVGTFNTYTFAASGSTPVIAGTAPTQTVSDMNINGFQVFTRPYSATSTAASPARVDIKIGKGLKATDVVGYFGTGKTLPVSLDKESSASNVNAHGAYRYYNSSTGVLTIDAGYNSVSANTSATLIDTINGAFRTSAYIVVNAGTTPSLVSFSKTVTDGRVISTAGTSIGNTVDVKVSFDVSPTFQNGLSFDSTNNRFVAGIAGEYSILAAVQFQSALYAAGNIIDLKIYKNGVYYSTISHKVIMAAITLGEGVSGSDIVHLNQNEYVEIFVFNNRTAGATSLSTTVGHNFFALAKQGL